MATAMEMVSVREVEGRGRTMVAAVPIAAGQVLLSEPPLLLYLDASFPPLTFCAHCSRSLALASSPIPCPSCTLAAFCTSACAAAGTHPPHVCQALQHLHAAPVDPHSCTQLRFLVAAYNLALTAPALFQQLLRLEGSCIVPSEAEFIHSLVQVLLKGWPPLDCSFQLTDALLAKDNRNAFAVMAPPTEPGARHARAYAFYSQASFFNHDCLPNACRFDYVDDHDKPNPSIYVRALHDIAVRTEVCLSYFPINWSLSERRNRLFEDYGFECKCERCEIESKWEDEGEGDGSSEEPDSSMDHSECEGEEEMDENPSKPAADGDFPHAMFFMKYLCPVEDCGGTMAPVPPEQVVGESGCGNSSSMECNVCGYLRTNEEFMRELQEHNGLEC